MADEPRELAAALRNWQSRPDGLFAQAWVSATAKVRAHELEQ